MGGKETLGRARRGKNVPRGIQGLAKDQHFAGRRSDRFQEGREDGTRRKGRDWPREQGLAGAVAVPSWTSRGRLGSVRSQRLTAQARQSVAITSGLRQLLRPLRPQPASGDPTGRQVRARALLVRGGRRQSSKEEPGQVLWESSW